MLSIFYSNIQVYLEKRFTSYDINKAMQYNITITLTSTAIYSYLKQIIEIK